MNLTPTPKLKAALAKMLPEKVFVGLDDTLCWQPYNDDPAYPVLDTVLLHLCWMVEETIKGLPLSLYVDYLATEVGTCGYPVLVHASWQQRVLALAKVKGVEL